MRRPGQLRLAAFLGALAALGFALLLSFALHLLFRRAGRLDFGEVNMIGLLEGLIFIVTYSFGLLYIRNGLGVPSPLLLSFGFSSAPHGGQGRCGCARGRGHLDAPHAHGEPHRHR